MNIKYEAKLPNEVPSLISVYKLAPPRSTRSHLTAISRRFGLTGKRREFITSEDWNSYNEGRFRVSVHRNSGALRYINLDKYGIETEKEFKLSKKDSDQIAQKFLRSAKMLPEKQSSLLKITHLRSGSADIKSNDQTERLLDAGVIYRRLVDDIPVDGPGGYAMVNIDPEGEVVGLRSVWRETAGREAKVKIVPPAKAQEYFEKSLSNLIGEVTVTTANFGYFEQNEMDRQKYLEPAYIFIYVVQNGDISHKSVEVIPAGQQTFAQLKGKKRFGRGEQKPRSTKNQ
jgi:hypothetical protein